MESSLSSLVESSQQRAFGQAKETALPKYCRECEVRFACNGECPKHPYVKTPEGEDGLNSLCAGYKMFFRHADPYMRIMAAELNGGRAPANVMRHITIADAVTAFREAGRNDPYPCGKGCKFQAVLCIGSN